MLLLIVIACIGAYYCMKIRPGWEVTAGEIPTTLTYRNQPKPDISARVNAPPRRPGHLRDTIRQPLGRNVVTGLWGNGTIRILTGFLTLFVAFYARATRRARRLVADGNARRRRRCRRCGQRPRQRPRDV